MMATRNKSAPTGAGGSRTLTYIILIFLAVLIGYYLVLPAFSPGTPATSTTATSTSTGGAVGLVSLTPSTDIAGTMVTVNGQLFPSNQAVTAEFNSSTIQINGTGGPCVTTSAGDIPGCNFWTPKGIGPGSYAVKLTAGATAATATFTVPQYRPPESTIVVTLTSLFLGLVTQLVTRRVVDLDKERKMRAEVNAFNKEKREATLAKDKVKLDKLKKRELQVRQEQAKVSTARLKVTGITFVPLLVVYYLMASFLGGYSVIVAFTPIPIPVIAAPTLSAGVFEVSLFWWYFLSSFTFSTMLSRVLHTTT